MNPTFLASLVVLPLMGGAMGADPSITPNHSAYFPGEEIVIAFEGGPGNARDWIGVYPPDVEPDGDPPSTIWAYVDGTQTGTSARREGSIVFAQGLTLGGEWAVYFLLNDGYTRLATNLFSIVDPSTTLVRTSQRVYGLNEPIEVTFTNGPANPKDWIGIYREGQTPGGGVQSTRFLYTDGTVTGNQGLTDGTVAFPAGLNEPGNYVVYHLLDDGYDILASETFVIAIDDSIPRVLVQLPADGASNLPPVFEFSVVITNGLTSIVPATISLRLDDAVVSPSVIEESGSIRVSYSDETRLPEPGSEHVWLLTAQDNATPPNELRVESTVAYAQYHNIILPEPLYFEDFDDVPEGSLPEGWTQQSYTTPLNETEDLADLGSLAFSRWTVVNVERFRGTFITYSNPDNPDGWESDYQRVLTPNALNVVNGRVHRDALASGRMLFGNSGYQNSAASQVLYLFTPDFNFTGRTNIHLSFHSLWEQNQDSMAAIEFSIDGGDNWLPIAYFIDGPDIVSVTNEATGEISIDAETTFHAEHGDVARYFDEEGNEIGGTFGAFIAAPISSELGSYIQARVDDDADESKRIELFPLARADNQPAVRFRFAHAGTDSWYFGIDNFGLYSISSDPGGTAELSVARDEAAIVISWPADAAGYVLESTPALTPPNWQAVQGVTGNSHRITPDASSALFRLRK
jgi:hypothetical protein